MNNFARNLTLASALVLTLTLPAMAGINVNSPANDTDVTSPFTLSASSASCSSKSVVSMGYSFDSSTNNTVFEGQSIDAKVSASLGAHTLHVKSWGPNGAHCVTSIAITIKAASASAAASIPSSAEIVRNIDVLSGWKATHDAAGPGGSTGTMSTVSSPSIYGNSRKFVTEFKNNGDQRYSVQFSDNVNAKNIFYDTWIYLTSSASKIGNLEFDVNQVMSNGHTVLIGFQCDGYTGKWAYNANHGSASHPKIAWVSKGGTSCNPRSWSQNKWHHVQASFSRSSGGTVTYHSIWLDGVQTKLDVQQYAGADLNWDPVIVTQFQVDGLGSSGTVTAYLDSLSISVW